MGKVYYENWFAKLFLFSGYSTIMFLGFILTKKREGTMSLKTINHETIHQYQYIECLSLAVLISCIVAPFIFHKPMVVLFEYGIVYCNVLLHSLSP